MKIHFTVLALALLLAAASHAQTDGAPGPAQVEKMFEQAGPVPAVEFIPEAQMRGALYRVRPLADNDGLDNTYYVETEAGVEAVTGTVALYERIREIYAIEYLRGLSKTDEFRNALARSLEAKAGSASEIVRDPIKTLKSVPKGASRFFGRIGEGLKGGESAAESGGVLAGVTGVDQAKAKLAMKLGVNPYSNNEALQRELTATANATAGGGLIVNAATSFATGGAGAALTVVGVNQSLQDTLANSTPEDLRIVNRKKLFAMSVTRAQADEFLMHPWYSPWQETIVTDALARIGAAPAAFLSQASQARTPEDAVFFQRTAEILAKYHGEQAPLRSIIIKNGLACGIDQNGVLVVPLSCDYAIWAEQTSARADEFAAAVQQDHQAQGLALWVDGKVSPRLAEALSARRIVLKTAVLGRR